MIAGSTIGRRALVGAGLASLGAAAAGTKHKLVVRTRASVTALPVLVAGVLGLIALLVLFSVAADRAGSIDRVFAPDQGQDMRARGLPTVLAAIRAYFPWGPGLGGFAPMFRMHEPFALLKLTFFNHAHNDLLEIALDAGVPGLLLVAAGVVWWTRASARAWRSGSGTPAQAGSAMLLLMLLASLVDYPVRTPLMMAMAVIAALWLGTGTVGETAPALPPEDQHL